MEGGGSKSKANVKESEDRGLETSSDGELVNLLEKELRKVDSSLLKVQGAVEDLAVKIVGLNSGQAQNNKWTQDWIAEIQEVHLLWFQITSVRSVGTNVPPNKVCCAWSRQNMYFPLLLFGSYQDCWNLSWSLWMFPIELLH